MTNELNAHDTIEMSDSYFDASDSLSDCLARMKQKEGNKSPFIFQSEDLR